MSNNIKVFLTIELEGGTLVRKGVEEIENINWSLSKRDLDNTKKWKSNEGFEIVKRGTTAFRGCKVKTAIYRQAITEYAYNYMVSNECPPWFHGKSKWIKLSKIQRLEQHLARNVAHFNGKTFSYQILEN